MYPSGWLVVVSTTAVVFGAGAPFGELNNLPNSRNALSLTGRLSESIIDSIAQGAEMALVHCRDVFKWDQWNCPESAFSRRKNQPTTREMAFVRAIVSASIVYSVTKNCSQGNIEGCGCDPKLTGTIPGHLPGRVVDEKEAKGADADEPVSRWGGCSDHVGFGEHVAKRYLEESERGRDIQAYVNLQNSLAGRAVVRKSLTKKCKCHGVSGSCQLQTCWKQLAPFDEVAAALKERYQRAIYIDAQSHTANSVSRTARMQKEKPQTLVFLERSPDYCSTNKTLGLTGTKGRACSRSRSESATQSERKSCRNLCRSCGHKVRKQRREIKSKCNCKFNWCCEVTCEVCSETVEEYFCD